MRLEKREDGRYELTLWEQQEPVIVLTQAEVNHWARVFALASDSEQLRRAALQSTIVDSALQL